MKWWPGVGISKMYTERKNYECSVEVEPLKRIFKRSMHIYTIDVGNSNLLNFEMKALQSPQYNTHRFGIFFTDTPRHTDLLVVLGSVHERMIEPLKETVEQMPKPFGILLIGDSSSDFLPNVVARMDGYPEAGEILAALIEIKEGGGRR